MTIQKEIEKLKRLSELGVRFKHFESVSSHKICHFAKLTARYTNTEMARFTQKKRFALLAAFAIRETRVAARPLTSRCFSFLNQLRNKLLFFTIYFKCEKYLTVFSLPAKKLVYFKTDPSNS